METGGLGDFEKSWFGKSLSLGALGEAGRGGNFFPEDGIFFVEDDFSATEDRIFFAEDEFSATEDGIFFVEDVFSATEDSIFFAEDVFSAAENGIFFVEDGFSAAKNGIFFVEDGFSAAEDGIFFAEDSASGRKNSAAESPMGGAEPGGEPFTPEGWLMAQWNSRATWSSGVLWGP